MDEVMVHEVIYPTISMQKIPDTFYIDLRLEKEGTNTSRELMGSLVRILWHQRSRLRSLSPVCLFPSTRSCVPVHWRTSC